MHQELFDKANSLQSGIKDKSQKVRLLTRLQDCCSLSCEIDGFPRNSMSRIGAFKSFSQEGIKNLIQYELVKLKSELEVLQKEFDELT